MAINDGIMLNSSVYTVLRECLSQEPTYLHILQLFTEVSTNLYDRLYLIWCERP